MCMVWVWVLDEGGGGDLIAIQTRTIINFRGVPQKSIPRPKMCESRDFWSIVYGCDEVPLTKDSRNVSAHSEMVNNIPTFVEIVNSFHLSQQKCLMTSSNVLKQ